MGKTWPASLGECGFLKRSDSVQSRSLRIGTEHVLASLTRPVGELHLEEHCFVVLPDNIHSVNHIRDLSFSSSHLLKSGKKVKGYYVHVT